MRLHLALSALTAIAFATTASAAVSVGDRAPNFKFEKTWNATGAQTQLDDYRGKLVIVEAWATW